MYLHAQKFTQFGALETCNFTAVSKSLVAESLQNRMVNPVPKHEESKFVDNCKPVYLGHGPFILHRNFRCSPSRGLKLLGSSSQGGGKSRMEGDIDWRLIHWLIDWLTERLTIDQDWLTENCWLILIDNWLIGWLMNTFFDWRLIGWGNLGWLVDVCWTGWLGIVTPWDAPCAHLVSLTKPQQAGSQLSFPVSLPGVNHQWFVSFPLWLVSH